MNKALPWNISGVGFDARETAREAARRQGKSLGEWLHGVIADHASELGVATQDVGEQDRIDAVTARLERLSRRPAEVERRPRPDEVPRMRSRADRTERDTSRHEALTRPVRAFNPRSGDQPFPDMAEDDDDLPPRQASSRRDPDAQLEQRRVRRAPMIEETEFLLEEAVDTMERRALRVQRRTDDALASLTRLMEANEAKRANERDAVRDLSDKLSGIEAKLAVRSESQDETPITGALARLEARLETIGRRSTAETSVRGNLARKPFEPAADAEPLRRLEDKLATILQAVEGRPQTTKPQADASPVDRRLGDAIAEISRRQHSLDEPRGPILRPAAADLPRRQPPFAREAESSAESSAPWQRSLTNMQSEIAGLASQIGEMRRAVIRAPAEPAVGVDLDGLRSEIGAMSETLSGLAPRGTVAQLQGSIETLTQRIETSRGEGYHQADLGSVEAVIGDLRQSLSALDPRPTLGVLEREIRTIAAKVDGLSNINSPVLSRLQHQMAEIHDLLAKTAARPLAVEQIEQRVTALADQMQQLGQRPLPDQGFGSRGFGSYSSGSAADGIRALIADPAGSSAFEKIEDRLETLARKLEDAIPSPDPRADVAGLERLVRDLGRKIEDVQAPGADSASIEALQQQVEMLAGRFAQSEGGLASLITLKGSMQDLFTHLEETRAKVETSAAEAARQALKVAIDEGRGQLGGRGAPDVVALQALQRDADVRTQTTLNAVHQTLEHVVGRMTAMEADLRQTKRKPASGERPRAPNNAAATPANRSDLALGGIDPLRDPLFAHRLPEGAAANDRAAKAASDQPTIKAAAAKNPAAKDPAAKDPAAKTPSAATTRPKAPVVDEDAGRANFIAAARRAAQVAQSDSAIGAIREPAVANDPDVRAGLLAKSRDYVATHKRPVLLSVAAVFVVLGTMAVMQRMSFDGDDPNIAFGVPAKTVRMANAAPSYLAPSRATSVESSLAPSTDSVAPRSSVTASAEDLTPSALPKGARALAARIPGSDPIQTGSISSLPSFAAQAPTPALPAGLIAAADAGNGAAQYTLGSQYADGKVMPRDFKLAAQWYGKAAAQGLAPAQYRLAALYEKGLGIDKDKTKAKSLYERAADAGNPRAMHNLAVLLADGDGKPDYAAAAIWFRKAAQYGVHDSQYNLAILLARGLGTDQSMVQSYQWFAIAAAHNDPDAAKKRDEVGDKLSANDLAVAKALAASFQPKTASPPAIEVASPPGGWDSVGAASNLNSARSRISSL